MKIKVRYYNMTLEITKKVQEDVEFPAGTTVNSAIENLAEVYGYKFKDRAFVHTDSMEGKITRANVYLNNRPVDYEYDYPEKLETVLNEGDTLSFGSLIGGGSK